jgi:Predicted metal-binding integral membrane protein
MWSFMMMAMMLPSAAPMILTFAGLNRKNRIKFSTISFTAAYLVIWIIFSGGAVFIHWLLQHTEFISAKMVSSSILLSGILLITVGVLQFSPLKKSCLKHCRSPIGFLMTDWRKGVKGAWIMGFRHGWYCLGCCYALMLLLFVGGVMNLAWVAALTLAVAIEKMLPHGERISQFLGAGLILAGVIKITLN